MFLRSIHSSTGLLMSSALSVKEHYRLLGLYAVLGVTYTTRHVWNKLSMHCCSFQECGVLLYCSCSTKRH
jgi:hypothetical protein